MRYDFEDITKGLLAFFAILFAFSTLQAMGTAITTPSSEKIIVYNFVNYTFFQWVMQTLYWLISICLAIWGCKFAMEG